MEKVIEMSSQSLINYKFDLLNLSLSINNNPYKIDINDLILIGRRKNPKREFIFISKVIGKHIPMYPNTLKIIGALLARKWIFDRYEIESDDIKILTKGLKDASIVSDYAMQKGVSSSEYSTALKHLNSSTLEKSLNKKIKLNKNTLFIGFAETATGVAHSVFSIFENATIIHSSRINFKTKPISFKFSEPHSHASEHRIFLDDNDFFNDFEEIVLIDDEITTGTTALNLINNLPRKTFGILSILDLRNDKQNSVNNESIIFSSLITGSIPHSEAIGAIPIEDKKILDFNHNIIYEDIEFHGLPTVEGYLDHCGRFGTTSKENKFLWNKLTNYSAFLKSKRSLGNCLCLGHGEFIFIPSLISCKMGQHVYFHSSTCSPIIPHLSQNYGINNKMEITIDVEKYYPNIIYNIPLDFYDDVFYFSENPLPMQIKKILTTIFNQRKIKNIVFVSWK